MQAPASARRWSASLLALAVIVLLAATGLSLRTSARLADTISSASHTQQVLEQVNRLWGVLGDRDSQVLRFLLTGRESNLVQFRANVHEFEAAATRLQALVNDDPAQRDLLVELRRVHGLRMQRSEMLIALKQRAEAGDAGAVAALAAEFDGSPGTGQAEAMRAALEQMAAREQAMLDDRLRERALAIAQARSLVLAAIVLALVAGAIALVALGRARRRADEALRASIEAEQARRAARERQAGIDVIAHDLRQHLGNIQFSLAMLRDAGDAGERGRLADTATSSANTGLLFLEAVLEQAAGEAQGDRARPLPLAPAIEAAVAALQLSAQQKAMRFALALDPAPCARVQPAVLAHVLANLLSNALKYAPPGSVVDVELATAGDRARMRILDRGPGVAEDERSRLFQRFQPLSARPTGGEAATGLGLALARQRTRAQGGDLRYEDRAGGGACFVLEWPLAEVRGGA